MKLYERVHSKSTTKMPDYFSYLSNSAVVHSKITTSLASFVSHD